MAQRLAFLLAIVVVFAATFLLSLKTYEPFESKPSDWDLGNRSCVDGEAGSNDIEILVVGVSKTGTSSMKAALDLLGYETIHWQGFLTRYFEFVSQWYNGDVKNPNLRRVFRDLPAKSALLDCFTPAVFDELRCAYPNAKVILTTREKNAWMKSYEKYSNAIWMYRWWDGRPDLLALSYFSRAIRLGQLLQWFGLKQPQEAGLKNFEALPDLIPVYRRSDEVIYGSMTPSRHWLTVRENLEAKIRASVPPEQLMVFDVTAGDGFDKLLPFLGMPTEQINELNLPNEFPQEYSNAKLKTEGGHNLFLRHNENHLVVAACLMLLVLMALFVVLFMITSELLSHLGSLPHVDATSHKFVSYSMFSPSLKSSTLNRQWLLGAVALAASTQAASSLWTTAVSLQMFA